MAEHVDLLLEQLTQAKESLDILLDLEKFLLEVGASGELTLANTGKWTENLAECREFIAQQRKFITGLEAG